VNIVKELESKNTKFHTYKPKQERSFRIVLKHIHATANLDDMKQEIEDLGHKVTSIWNIKKQSTKSLRMFNVENRKVTIRTFMRLVHFSNGE